MTEPRVSGLRLEACIEVLQGEPLRREASLDLALDLRDALQRIAELEAENARLLVVLDRIMQNPGQARYIIAQAAPSMPTGREASS